jgi:hypothetical protein
VIFTAYAAAELIKKFKTLLNKIQEGGDIKSLVVGFFFRRTRSEVEFLVSNFLM